MSKHVAVVGELSRLVDKYKLLEIGEVEQGLATSSGSDLKVGSSYQLNLHFTDTVHLKSVQDIIRNSAVPSDAKLRIVILFALRYQKSKANDISNLIQLMLENGVLREDAKVGYLSKKLQCQSCLLCNASLSMLC